MKLYYFVSKLEEHKLKIFFSKKSCLHSVIIFLHHNSDMLSINQQNYLLDITNQFYNDLSDDEVNIIWNDFNKKIRGLGMSYSLCSVSEIETCEDIDHKDFVANIDILNILEK